MSNLSSDEKAYNEWWMGRFDEKHYKIIRLFDHEKKVQTYTTANSRYSDQEDAEAAFFTADRFGMDVTSVAVNGVQFKRINGMIRRITDVSS
ncbi:hypothetical protein [Lactiplantibacillus pentosus]